MPSNALLSFLSYWILFHYQGEIRLPVVLEDQCHREIPNIQLFYRPVRQMVYAILFNLHHHTFLAEKQREQQSEKCETSMLAHFWNFYDRKFDSFVLQMEFLLLLLPCRIAHRLLVVMYLRQLLLRTSRPTHWFLKSRFVNGSGQLPIRIVTRK